MKILGTEVIQSDEEGVCLLRLFLENTKTLEIHIDRGSSLEDVKSQFEVYSYRTDLPDKPSS